MASDEPDHRSSLPPNTFHAPGCGNGKVYSLDPDEDCAARVKRIKCIADDPDVPNKKKIELTMDMLGIWEWWDYYRYLPDPKRCGKPAVELSADSSSSGMTFDSIAKEIEQIKSWPDNNPQDTLEKPMPSAASSSSGAKPNDARKPGLSPEEVADIVNANRQAALRRREEKKKQAEAEAKVFEAQQWLG